MNDTKSNKSQYDRSGYVVVKNLFNKDIVGNAILELNPNTKYFDVKVTQGGSRESIIR